MTTGTQVLTKNVLITIATLPDLQSLHLGNPIDFHNVSLNKDTKLNGLKLMFKKIKIRTA